MARSTAAAGRSAAPGPSPTIPHHLARLRVPEENNRDRLCLPVASNCTVQIRIEQLTPGCVRSHQHPDRRPGRTPTARSTGVGARPHARPDAGELQWAALAPHRSRLGPTRGHRVVCPKPVAGSCSGPSAEVEQLAKPFAALSSVEDTMFRKEASPCSVATVMAIAVSYGGSQQLDFHHSARDTE